MKKPTYEELEIERNELAAMVERLRGVLVKLNENNSYTAATPDSLIVEVWRASNETPSAALEAMKERFQTDVIEVIKDHFEIKFNPDDKFTAEWVVDLLYGYMNHIRHRAQEADNE